MRRSGFVWACVVGLALWACDSNGGTDAGGPGGDAGSTDAGDIDGGGTDAGTDGGGGGSRGLGAACGSDGECLSGVCYNATAGLELGTGYCTVGCTADSDCTGFPSDGYDYGCVTAGSDVRCMRRCPGGVGCPATDLCVEDFGTDGADICLDLSNDLCTSNEGCTGSNDQCTVLVDRDHGVTACFHPRAFGGEPQPYKTVGESCMNLPETPCTSTADCPSGYRCQRRRDGRDVCNPTPSETCNIFCLDPGVCTGVCDTDADCPSDMRCSDLTLPFIGNSGGAFDDSPYVGFHLCTYAAGSGASCATQGDCTTAGEVCAPGAGGDGSYDPICVTGVNAQPGEVCGDDPTTTAVEYRPCDGACIFNRCGEVCESDSDCPTGGHCLMVGFSATLDYGTCIVATTCATDGDCAAGEVCSDLYDQTGTVYSFCAPAQGGLPGGSVCTVDADSFVPFAERCDLGCQDTGRGRAEGRCGERCTTDADCPTDFICNRATFSISSRGTYPDRTDDVTTTIGGCAYVPGSRAACTRSADCPAGEVCAAEIDASGAVLQLCVTEVTGGADLGEACDVDTPCRDASRCTGRWDDPSLSFCTGGCARDSDCPTGFACRTPNLAVPAFDTPICMPPDDPRGTPL